MKIVSALAAIFKEITEADMAGLTFEEIVEPYGALETWVEKATSASSEPEMRDALATVAALAALAIAEIDGGDDR